jgi:hypothetical protein
VYENGDPREDDYDFDLDAAPRYSGDVGAVLREVTRRGEGGRRRDRTPRSRSAGPVEEVVILETSGREGRSRDYDDRRYRDRSQERSPRSRSEGRVEELVVYEYPSPRDLARTPEGHSRSSEGRYSPWSGGYYGDDDDLIIPQTTSNARPTRMPKVKSVSYVHCII